MEWTKATLNLCWQGKEPWQVSRDTLLLTLGGWALASGAHVLARDGLQHTLGRLVVSVARALPGGATLIAAETTKIVDQLEKMVIPAEVRAERRFVELPEQGLGNEAVLSLLTTWSEAETARWREGQASGCVYHGDPDLLAMLTRAYSLFAVSNPLHPDVFPYVRKMEAEVIAMTLAMLHGDDQCCGTMTSGGTESILMAMKAYRDEARSRGIDRPEVIAPNTAHAAFDKAAHYFGLKLISIPVDAESCQVDVQLVRRAITRNTVALVASAPAFPHGVLDPIEELGALALEHRVGLHVDMCLGGFLLPFVAQLQHGTADELPPLDFRVKGVTTISADSHKYGYSPKGTSIIMYRSPHLRHFQYFVAPDWTGGIYASPAMPGSRPGGLIAGTWAAMVSIGRDGYLRCARGIMEASRGIQAAIGEIDGIRVLGKPCMSVVAFATDPQSERGRALNIFKVGEALTKKGWSLNSLQRPASIHICCTWLHRDAAWQRFVADLRAAVDYVHAHPDQFKNGSAAIYGMAESVPDTTIVSDLAKGYIDVLLKA